MQGMGEDVRPPNIVFGVRVVDARGDRAGEGFCENVCFGMFE